MTAVSRTAPAVTGTFVDFDLHGLVGVRLVGATEADIVTVTRQIGPMRSTLSGPPDIVVRFEDHIPMPADVTYAAWGESAYDDADFYLLRGKGNVRSVAVVPFQGLGGRCEFRCERGTPSVPHLLAAINLALVQKGVLPLHASAFVTAEGQGVLACGWAKGGKTETLLAFMGKGARYVGDEWVYLTPQGMMYGVPEPIRLWHWQLRQLAHLPGVPDKRRMQRLGAVAAASAWAERAGRLAAVPGAGVLRRLSPVLARQAYAQIAPADLFGADRLTAGAKVDSVLFVTSGSAEDISLRPADPRTVSARMVASLQEERQPFLAHHRQFRFAFPDRVNALIDNVADRERALLDALLGERQIWQLTHAYPLQIDTLVEPVLTALRAGTGHRPLHQDLEATLEASPVTQGESS